MTREQCLEAINSPGKFEGEPVYAPYFYDAMLDGDGEWINDVVQRFDVTDDERKMFPELEDCKQVDLLEDSDGFVYVRIRRMRSVAKFDKFNEARDFGTLHGKRFPAHRVDQWRIPGKFVVEVIPGGDLLGTDGMPITEK